MVSCPVILVADEPSRTADRVAVVPVATGALLMVFPAAISRVRLMLRGLFLSTTDSVAVALTLRLPLVNAFERVPGSILDLSRSVPAFGSASSTRALSLKAVA